MHLLTYENLTIQIYPKSPMPLYPSRQIKKLKRAHHSSNAASLKPMDTEEIESFKYLNIRTLKKSLNNSYNPTPTFRNQSEVNQTDPAIFSPYNETEESSFYYPKDPKIHTVNYSKPQNPAVNFKFAYSVKRPLVYTKRSMNTRNRWQNLSREHKFSGLSPLNKQHPISKSSYPKGKVRKGICKYPSLTPSPIAIRNIKLSF